MKILRLKNLGLILICILINESLFFLPSPLAWAQGYTGKGITTAIMDDGVDYMHPDLKDNYVSFQI